tara:strand:- start:535 stop:879 length:345 start_codon:yes stop_codon:yes gene_type:complete
MLKNDYVEITMGGDKYKLVANHSSIFGLDDILECGMIDMMEKFIVKGLRPRQVVSIILLGLEGNNDTRLSYEDISKHMFKDGAVQYHKAVSAFCSLALQGLQSGDDIEGKSESV